MGLYVRPVTIVSPGHPHRPVLVLLLANKSDRLWEASFYQSGSVFCCRLSYSMDHIIDTIMLYTLNNGALTWSVFNVLSSSLLKLDSSVTTVVSMVCVSPSTLFEFPWSWFADSAPQWLTMPDNLVFLALHLAISKCARLSYSYPREFHAHAHWLPQYTRFRFFQRGLFCKDVIAEPVSKQLLMAY